MFALSVRLQEGRSLCNINTTFGRGAIRELRTIYWQENLHSFIEPNCQSNAASPKLLSSLPYLSNGQLLQQHLSVLHSYFKCLWILQDLSIRFDSQLVPFIFSFQKEKMVNSCFKIIWIEPGTFINGLDGHDL